MFDAETIKRYCKEAHDNAIDKGFYSCPRCGGVSGYPRNEKTIALGTKVKEACKHCNGSGVDPNKNIGELLMLIVSELGEALEAHRCGKFAKDTRTNYTLLDDENYAVLIEDLKNGAGIGIKYFNLNIKDTFEDEIADVFIRLFDLCAYVGIIPDKDCLSSIPKIQKNIGQCLLRLTFEISSMDSNGQYMNGYLNENNYGFIFAYLREFCNFHNIPIEKHITAKMAYNKTRPRLHGKEY